MRVYSLNPNDGRKDDKDDPVHPAGSCEKW